MPRFRALRPCARPLLALLLALPAPALADGGEPVTVRPGELDGTFIRPVMTKLRISQALPDGTTVPDWGTSTYEVQVLDEGGRRVVRRTQVTTTPNRTITDVGIADHRTLAPISSEESDTLGKFERYEYAGDRVKIERAVEGKRATTEVALEMPVFDFLGGVYDLIVAALPLREGISIRIPVLIQEPGTPGWQTFQVVGREALPDAAGKPVDTWTVETRIKDFRVVFSVAKEPPFLFRIVNHGPRGGRQIFEPVAAPSP